MSTPTLGNQGASLATADAQPGTQNYGLEAELKLQIAGQTLGGEVRMRLLACIAEFGSITHAAKAAGLSYKAAWDALEAMHQLTGLALVERLAGGKGGGGTRLTARGQQLLENYRQIQAAHQRFVRELNAQTQDLSADLFLLRKLSMKTSVRNQFWGQVAAIKTGAVQDEVQVQLAQGLQLVATISQESTQHLQLKPGSEVFALVPANNITLAEFTELDGTGIRFSARNQIKGIVERWQTGAVSTEVVLRLEADLYLAVTITNESATAMNLQQGQTLLALFKAGSVILGVPE